MSEQQAESVPEAVTDHVSETDSENEAIIDASRTFFVTVIGAVLFCAAALFVILSTRMG